MLVDLEPNGKDLFDKIYPGHPDRICEAMKPVQTKDLEEILSIRDVFGGVA